MNNEPHFSIQDEATGKYWCGPVTGWVDNKVGSSFIRAPFWACTQYEVFSATHTEFCRTARIVPAPPLEMTDAEAWEWFRTCGDGEKLALSGSLGGFCVWRCGWNAGYFDAPCDAIRAARKKLESK